AAYAADKENLVPNLVDMLYTVIDRVEADPLDAIVDIVPQLLYFINCGGLTTAMDNILYALNVATDTIRPIYDVNIYKLVSGFDLRFAETDPVNFLFEKLSGLIYDSTGLNFAVDFTVDSLYEALDYGTPTAFTSANGSTAYRLENIDKTSIVDAILGYAIDELVFSDNTDAYLEYIKERFGLNDTLYAVVVGIISGVRYAEEQEDSSGKALLFWVFFGADNVADAVLDYYRMRQEEPLDLLVDMSVSGIGYIQNVEFMIEELYKASYHTTFVELTGRKADAGVAEEVIATAGAIAEISRLVLKLFAMIFAYIRMLVNLFGK
ncbi:MAG: hypothetical protein K6C36_08365, partial [Clostridia bacterium]|nr:hypothetical protein [Clostridia bacterium]